MKAFWFAALAGLSLHACTLLAVRPDLPLPTELSTRTAQVGLRLVSQLAHSAAICHWSVSADGRRAATIDCPTQTPLAQGSLRVWDLIDGAVLTAVDWNDGLEHDNARIGVGQLRLSANGGQLLVVGASVQLFDTATGALLSRLLPHRPLPLLADDMFTAAAFCGAAIAVGTDRGQLWLWQPQSAELPLQLAPHQRAIAAVVCDGGGQTAFSVDREGVVQQQPTKASANASAEPTRNAGAGLATAAALSPDGTLVATLAADSGRLVLWRTADLSAARVIQTLPRAMPFVGWDASGRTLWAGDGSRWSVASGAQLGAAKGNSKGEAIAWLRTGGWLRAAGPKLTLLRPATDSVTLGVQGEPIEAAAMAENASLVATVSAAGLHVFSAALLQQQALIPGMQGPLAIDATGKHIACLCGAALCVVAADKARVIQQLRLPSAPVRAMTWGADPAQVVLAFGDGRVWLVDFALGTHAEQKVRLGVAYHAWLAPHGRAVAWADSRTVSVQDLTRNVPLQTWQADGGGGIADVGWYADARHLLVQHSSHAIAVRAQDAVAQRWLEPTGGQAIVRLAVAPDGQRVAQGTGSGGVQVVDLRDGETRTPLTGHHSSIVTLQWSADGQRLLSAAREGDVRLWRLSDHSSVALVGHGDDWLVYGDDGLFDSSRRGASLVRAVVKGKSYPVEQEAAQLNRPDLLLQRTGLAPSDAVDHYSARWRRRVAAMGLSQAGTAELFATAPHLSVLDSAVRAGKATLHLEASCRRAGTANWQVLANGALAASGRVELAANRPNRLTVEVALAPGKTTLQAILADTAGTESLPATAVVWSAQSAPTTLYVAAFGVSQYRDSALNLAWAHRDAQILAQRLGRAQGQFAQVVARPFVDHEVIPETVLALRQMFSVAQPQDTVVLFVAGHGMRSRDAAADFYYLSHHTDLHHLRETSIALDALLDVLATSPAQRKLLLLDACESGDGDAGERAPPAPTAVAGGGRGLQQRGVRGVEVLGANPAATEVDWRRWRQRDRLIYSNLLRRDGIVMLSSSRASEVSFEMDALQHGAFTFALLEALQGDKADGNRDGAVDALELRTYVGAKVAELTGERQHPMLDRDNPLSDLQLPVVGR